MSAIGQNSVEVDEFLKSPTSRNFRFTGTNRKRIELSGPFHGLHGIPAVIDHLETTLPSRSALVSHPISPSRIRAGLTTLNTPMISLPSPVRFAEGLESPLRSLPSW